jgi:hypothetical protein
MKRRYLLRRISPFLTGADIGRMNLLCRTTPHFFKCYGSLQQSG